MFYLIGESLTEVPRDALRDTDKQYIAVLSGEEWKDNRDSFDMGIDIDPDVSDIYTTKAEVNYDSLTGSFSIPDRRNLSGEDIRFAFALDEKGVVFIDNHGSVDEYINNIRLTKRWNLPSLERFLYDFLDQIVKDDLRLMERYELELNAIEQTILSGDASFPSGRLNRSGTISVTCACIMSSSSTWVRNWRRMRTISSNRKTSDTLKCS